MGANTLSKQIAEVAMKKRSQRDINRAAFLALREDICAALDDGWSLKRIWETLKEHNRISFGYTAFTGYANRLIPRDRNKQEKPSGAEKKPETSASSNSAMSQGSATPPKNPTQGFKYNPNIPKDELW